MIVTDEQGRPVYKPEPGDYSTLIDFIRARHAYNDRITEMHNQAFDASFKHAMKAGAGGKKEK